MRVQKKYSLEFKQMVVEEYLRTGCTQKSLLLKYDIRFVGSIDKWMRERGASRPRTGGGRRREALPVKLRIEHDLRAREIDLAHE